MPVKNLRGKAHPAAPALSHAPKEVCACASSPCIIARGAQAVAIEQALHDGTTLKEIMRTYGVKYRSLVRHRCWLRQRTASPQPPPMEDSPPPPDMEASPPRPSQVTVPSAWPCPHTPQTLLADGPGGRLKCQECETEEPLHGSDVLRNLLADATRLAWRTSLMRGVPELMETQRASAALFVRIVHEMVRLRDSAQGRERP